MQEDDLALKTVLGYYLIRKDSGFRGREKDMSKDTSRKVCRISGKCEEWN